MQTCGQVVNGPTQGDSRVAAVLPQITAVARTAGARTAGELLLPRSRATSSSHESGDLGEQLDYLTALDHKRLVNQSTNNEKLKV